MLIIAGPYKWACEGKEKISEPYNLGIFSKLVVNNMLETIALAWKMARHSSTSSKALSHSDTIEGASMIFKRQVGDKGILDCIKQGPSSTLQPMS